MRVIATVGNDDDVAKVYIVDMGEQHLIECVESTQPPFPRQEKWILLVSTMFGCPIGCQICDAGGSFKGALKSDEIFAQIDFLVKRRFPDGHIPSRHFKIQFARMGEPSLCPSVLDVLDELPSRYDAPGLMPSISTIAPRGSHRFFERLIDIKNHRYNGGRFQFQFSIHSTNPIVRDELVPVKKWDFSEMAEYGERYYSPGDRKITLNFALARDVPVDPLVLNQYFDPDKFLIKITPLNPTYRAQENGLVSYINPYVIEQEYSLVDALQTAGYQVIVSIGEVVENDIGSNCGQYIRRHLEAQLPIGDGYRVEVQNHG